MMFVEGILRNILFVAVVWYLYCLISRTNVAQKPVVKWNPEETCQWLKELGEWTEDGLVPYFRDHGINGHLLMALQETDLDELLKNTGSVNKRAFLDALSYMGAYGIKPPADFNLRKAILYTYGLQRHARTTLLLMYLFDYSDSFLPFIHVTVPVLDNITSVDLNTFQFQTPSVGQWVEFTALWLGLPYMLFGRYAYYMTNWWMSSFVQLTFCAVLTYVDYSRLQPGLGLQSMVLQWASWRLRVLHSSLYQVFTLTLLWHYTPNFLSELFIDCPFIVFSFLFFLATSYFFD